MWDALLTPEQLSVRAKITLVWFPAEMEALFQVESTQGSGNCARSRGLACLSPYPAKTLNPWSAVGLWIIPAPPTPLPTIPSCNPSSLLVLPCEHQRSGRVVTELSCTLESREAGLHTVRLIFYFCYCQRNMQKALSCRIRNVLLSLLSVFAQLQKATLFLMDLKKWLNLFLVPL